jgi:hypothetical protein
MAWLPLIVLFSLRAYESERKSDRLFNACAAGAMLGMTFLAGSIHIAIMDAIVVGSLALYVATHTKTRHGTAFAGGAGCNHWAG